MPVDKLIPRKLNSDIDAKLIDKASMIDALNLYAGDDADGGGGVLKNIRGNTVVSQGEADFFGGDSRVLGSVTDEKTGIAYFFVFSSEAANQGVWAYDPEGKLAGDGEAAVRLIYKSAQFNFKSDGFVKGDIVHINKTTFLDKGEDFDKDAVLFFTDNENEPRKINVYRAYNSGGSSIHGDNAVAEADFITACPKAPLYPISFVFEKDVNRSTSNFKGTSGFQFAYQHVYIDGFESAISTYSDVAFPPSILNQGADPYAFHDNFNRCTLLIPQPGPEIKSVKILSREGQTGSFLFVDEVDVSSLYNGDSYTGLYYFYNDTTTKGVSRIEVNKQFDSVPRKAKAQAVSDNRLFYGNYLDGFDPVDVDVNTSVIFRTRPEDFTEFTLSTNAFIGLHEDDGTYVFDDTVGSKRKSTGFSVDFSELPASAPPNTSVNIKVTLTPKQNWHIYNSDTSYHQSSLVGDLEEYTPTTNFSVDGQNQDELYETQSNEDAGQTYLNGTLSGGDDYKKLLVGDNNGIKGADINLKWRSKFRGNGGGGEAFDSIYDVKIGTSAAHPIILNGGSLIFNIGFTTSVNIPNGFKTIVKSLTSQLFYGVDYDNLTYKEKINSYDLVQTVESTINHSLPIQHGSIINQAYIGQEGSGNTSLSQMIMSAALTGDPFGLGTNTNAQAPVGYFIFKSATAKFGLKPVANPPGGDKVAFRLALLSLENVKPYTCFKSFQLNSSFVNTDDPAPDDYDFLGEWGVIDPQQAFFGEEGNEISFDIDLAINNPFDLNYGELSFANSMGLGSVLDPGDTVNLGSGQAWRYKIGFLTEDTFSTSFTLMPNEGDNSNIACVFDGEAGPGGGPSRGGGGNDYDDIRMFKQGSIPNVTPIVYDAVALPPPATSPLFDSDYFNSWELGQWSMGPINRSSAITGRISGSPISGGLFASVSILPLVFGVDYPVPEEDTDNDGIIDPYSVNFTLLQPSAVVLPFFSGTFSGDVFRSFKSNCSHDFGIVYYDERGRHGAVNYLGNVFVPGLSQTDRPSGSVGGPASVAIQMNHNPPDWAHYFKIVYGGNSTIDSFIQYTVSNAYVRTYGEIDPPESGNMYISLSHLQGSPISYTTGFGAKSVEGGINMYKFKEGDKLRIISTGPNQNRAYYSSVYEFDVVDLVDVAPPTEDDPSSITLLDSEESGAGLDSPRLTGQFLVIKDNPKANGFRYTEVSTGGESNKWRENCIVEIYSPSKKLDIDEKFYYEMPGTYRVVSSPEGTRLHAPSVVVLNKGDVWFRKSALAWKDSDYTNLLPLEIAGEQDAQPNFDSVFIESSTATDLHRSDFKGYGRANLVNDEAKESRREASITYSDKSNPESSKSRYTSFDSNKLNFSDYDYTKGEINFLSPTTGYIISIQSNRSSLIPISKNVISDASGGTSLISSNVVLGEAIEQPNVSGTDSPSSVVERDDRVYYANKAESKVYLYSRSGGSKDISTNFVGSSIKKAVLDAGSQARIVGGYDELKEEYLMTIIPFSSIDAPDVVFVNPPAAPEIAGGDFSGFEDLGGAIDGGGVPPDGTDGLGLTGFQVFIDTDGDGVIGINEFLQQTSSAIELPLIPAGEVAVPASLDGISELAGQITVDGSAGDQLAATVLSVIDGVNFGGTTGENTAFIIGGVLGVYAAQNSIELGTPEGLSEALIDLNLDPTLLASEDADGASSFTDNFNLESNYDLIHRLIANGPNGWNISGISDNAIDAGNVITKGDLGAVSATFNNELIIDPIAGLPPGTSSQIFDADINNDNIIGTADLLAVLTEYGFSVPPGAPDDTVIFQSEDT